MSRRWLLLLLLLVVPVLLWMRGRQDEARLDPGVVAYQLPLFGGLVSANVVELRVENLARGVELRLEREPDGPWSMVDPILDEASPGMVRALLGELERGVGKPPPTITLEAAGLAPPKAVLSFLEARADGDRAGRVEVGAVDVEGRYVYVRVRDHPAPNRPDGSAVFLGSRSLETFLDRDRDDFRDPHALPPRAEGVRRIVRAGSVRLQPDAPPTDLELEIELDGQGGWRMTRPVSMAVDPSIAQTLVRGLLNLSAVRFLADDAETAARYAPNDPSVRFEIERLDGETQTLDVHLRDLEPQQLASEARWIGRLAGSATILELDTRDVMPTILPHTTLFDLQLVRALRDEIRAIELTTGDRVLTVERRERDWQVQVSDDVRTYAASHGRVEDLLAAFERAYIASFPPMVGFPEGSVERSFVVRTRGGAEFSGRFGAPWRDDQLGAEGVAFLRTGDELPGLVGAGILEWFERGVEDLRRQILWSVAEGQAQRVELAREGRRLAYRREGAQWLPEGARTEADVTPAAFYPFLERLLKLKAESWVDDPGGFDQAWLVTLESTGSEPRVVEVGRRGGGAYARLSDGAVVTVDPDWVAGIEALLR